MAVNEIAKKFYQLNTDIRTGNAQMADLGPFLQMTSYFRVR